jgi:hypothetical protein
MERCATLIEKLQTDLKNGASAEQLLMTLQILQKELVSKTAAPTYKKSSKVTVVMPNLFPTMATEMETSPEAIVPIVDITLNEEPIIFTNGTPVAAVPEYAVIKEVHTVKEDSEREALRDVIDTEEIESVVDKEQMADINSEPILEKEKIVLLIDETDEDDDLEYVVKPFAAPIQEEVITITATEQSDKPQKLVLVDESDDDEEDTYTVPTLAQQHLVSTEPVQAKEAEPVKEWQEKQSTVKKEHAEALAETPLKDLKKGIGVNDKFLFVQELFRNDEVMYERSIKTINSFNIYPEAQYWIERELKIKLGWNDEQDTVQQFYHLVKRRFASM